MNRLLRKSLLLLVVSLMLGAAAEAKKPNLSCLSGNCPSPTVPQVMDEQAQFLIGHLASHPELMNLEYLKFHIGRPEDERYERYNLNHNYYWYDRDHHLRYHLEQKQRVPGQVTEATMTVRLDGMGLAFDDLEALYGKGHKRFFDYNAHPCEIFSMAPNTVLAFSSQPNTFIINQAKIKYSGEPLVAPSAEHMTTAESQMVAKSALSASVDDPAGESLPLAQAHAKTRPLDPQAHLRLAQALQRQSRLHDAISEYKLALALSGENHGVRDTCLDALRAMHVISDNYEPENPRDLKFHQNGQRLRVHGHQQTTADNNVQPTQ